MNLPEHTKFWVLYQKAGYMSDQTEIMVTAEHTGRLLNLGGTRAYYAGKGAQIIAEVSRVPELQRKQAWNEEWKKIEKSPLPPAAKGSIARTLRTSAPKALQDDMLFSAYSNADPDLLDKLDILRTEPTAKREWMASYHVNEAILDNIAVTAAPKSIALVGGVR